MNGIQVNKGAPFQEFSQSPAFYVVDDFLTASQFAHRKTQCLDGEFRPAVVAFRYVTEATDTPNSFFRFDDSSDDWKRYVSECESDNVECDTSECHQARVVRGPLSTQFRSGSSSPSLFARCPPTHCTQICFKTNEVARRQLTMEGIIVLPI